MKCDMDCLHCTLPVDKCTGGSYKTANKAKRANTMNDGKKGSAMSMTTGCRKGQWMLCDAKRW